MAFAIPEELERPAHLLMAGNSRLELGGILKRLDVERPLLITDATMARLGMLDELQGILQASALQVASVLVADDQEPTDLTIAPVREALEQHAADGAVALGGGSVIDSAKAAVLLYTHGGVVRDFAYPADIPAEKIPLFAIPTTAGTGSEVTAATVVTDTASDEKLLLMGKGLIPDGAIVDYRLSMTQPRRLTADTGLDALTHAIEAYVSRKANPHTDLVALQAMSEIYRSIRTAYTEGDNEDARRRMMHGATLAGMAFSNASVALVHGMSRPIGARFHVPHGLSNAMLLPAVTAFSLTAAEARYAQCARALGIATDEISDAEAAHGLVHGLHDLVEALEVPTLAAFGIEREAFEAGLEDMAVQALASGSPSNNPRVPSIDEMTRLYQLIYDNAPLDDALSL